MPTYAAVRFGTYTDGGDGTASKQLRILTTSNTPVTVPSTAPIAFGIIDGNGYIYSSPDGSLMVITSQTAPYLHVFNTADWSAVTIASPPTSGGGPVAFSEDGAYLAVIDIDAFNFTVYDTSDWSVAHTETPSGFDYYQAVLFVDGKLYTEFWNDTASELQIVQFETATWTAADTITGGDVAFIACGYDQTLVVATNGSPYITFYDTTDNSLRTGLSVGTLVGAVSGAAFTADGTYFCIASYDSYTERVQVFDTASSPNTPASYTLETMGSSMEIYPSGYGVNGAVTGSTSEAGFMVRTNNISPSFNNGVRYLRKTAGTWSPVSMSIGGTSFDNGEASSNIYTAFFDEASSGETGDVIDSMDLASIDTGAVSRLVSSSMLATDTHSAVVIFNLIDTIAASDTLAGNTLYAIIERVGVADSLIGTGVFTAALAEALSALDKAGAIYRRSLSESLNVADVLTLAVNLAKLIERMQAQDLVSSRLAAVAAVSLMMTLADEFRQLTLAQIIELIETDDDVAARLAANVTLAETISVVSSLLAGRSVLVGLTDTAEFDESLDAIGAFKAVLAESAGFEAEFILFGEVYQGWVVNNETGAPSEYQNFPFNSMSRIGQTYYGASETGLYQMGGDTDDGDAIQARILTGELDFGSPQIKRIERAYMGYTTTGDLVLKVIATVNGSLTEYWYKASPLRSGEVTQTRVPIGKGIDSRYWQFEIVNTDGADFELDRIDLQVLNLQRRI